MEERNSSLLESLELNLYGAISFVGNHLQQHAIKKSIIAPPLTHTSTYTPLRSITQQVEKGKHGNFPL